MSFNSNITPGRPPLLWSEVNDAFVKINENFDSLIAAGLGGGLVPVDFNTLDTDVSPTTDNLHSLGSITNRWKSVYTGEHTLSDPTNGVFLGNAQIKGLGFTVNIPAGSTIGGDPLTGVGTSLIIDPEKTFFKTIQVNNDLSVVATEFGSTVNLLSGSGISLTVNSSSDSIEIDNTGILSVAAGLGITAATVSGVATIVNAGVRSLQNTTALPLGRSTGAGINITGSTGDNLRITNTGVISVTAGLGITVSVDVATGEFQVTNAAPAQPAFQQIEVNGDSVNRLIADGTAGVFRIVSGQGITLARTVSTDTMSITIDPVFDLKGSIFGDDSTKIVDAVENKVYAEFFGNLTGNITGNVTGNVFGNIQGSLGLFTTSVTVGSGSQGSLYTSTNDVYLGNASAGAKLGLTVREGILQNTVVEIDSTAKTIALDNTYTVTGFVGNVTGTLTGNIFTSLIDSADSSAITVTPATIFSSDVTVQNDITAVRLFTSLIDSPDSSTITVTPTMRFNSDIVVENDIQLLGIESSIRGTDKIKFVPSNADELSDNVRLEVYSESTIEPRLAIDTPDGVDLTLSSGLAGIVISKINGRVNLAAGNNAFIVRENGSWAMTPLDAAPVTATVGVYIANGTTWDPASKANSRPYPVWYDGVAYNALY
jgi:hypothetical protein